MPDYVRFEATLPFYDQQGKEVASASIVAAGPQESSLIRIITAAEALADGEEEIQLIEGQTYEYELSDCSIRLDDSQGVVSRSRIGSDLERGLIRTGNRTGLLRLHLLRGADRVATGKVEVRSLKIGYREDYRAMLSEIVEASVDLVMQLRAPTESRFVVDEMADPATLQQQFFFLKGLLDSQGFLEAVGQILASPHSQLISEEEEVPLGRRVKADSRFVRELMTRTPRQPTPLACAALVKAGLTTLPLRVTAASFTETVDTAENRFVKHALATFGGFLASCDAALRKAGEEGTAFSEREIAPLLGKIEELLSDDFFAEISPATTLPLGSPVLHRKAGYREVLQAWVRFEGAARLVWSGGDDVFGAGQRDVATLYEYWLFFVLWKALVTVSPNSQIADIATEVLERTDDGFGLKLRRGEFLPVEGSMLELNGRKYRMQFSYNRTFPAAKTTERRFRSTYQHSYPLPGSWTRGMRPDFTVTFWADGYDYEADEEAELAIHLHFDAKYSVEKIQELFGTGEDSLTEEKTQQRAGIYKRGDLLKMHSYRDAIRRTQGAYILYPGTNSGGGRGGSLWIGFHEILPGLGAFAIRPGDDRDLGTLALRNFLLDVLEHLGQKASRRERLAKMNRRINR